MRLLKEFFRIPVRVIFTFFAHSGIRKMKKHGNAAVTKLAVALEESLAHTLDENERMWSEKIEAVRSRLRNDDRVITVMDYGAGHEGETRTAEQMEAGVPVQTTVMKSSTASKPLLWAVFLGKLVKAFGARKCLELGACVGISGSYIAAAQKTAGNGGRIITLEGAETLAEVTRSTFSGLGLDNASVVTGKFSNTLAGVLTDQGPFDMAFIDGHHDEQATIDYFNMIKPHLTAKAVLVFDNIAWSAGMRRAWAAVTADPAVNVALDLRTVGICVIDADATDTCSFKIALV